MDRLVDLAVRRPWALVTANVLILGVFMAVAITAASGVASLLTALVSVSAARSVAFLQASRDMESLGIETDGRRIRRLPWCCRPRSSPP